MGQVMTEKTDEIEQKFKDMLEVLEDYEDRFNLIRGSFNALNRKVERLQTILLPPVGDIEDVAEN